MPCLPAFSTMVVRIVLLMLILTGIPLLAQTEEEKSVLAFQGQAILSADLYQLEASPDGVISPRRPSSLVRLFCTPTLSYGDFKLPLTLMISSNQTNATTPRAPHQSLTQYLQNPMNRITLSPQYKWARVDLGTYTPRYSELSTGNQQVFGAGIDLSPGPVRIAGFVGTSQRAIEPDSLNGIAGAFERRTIAGRLAIGSSETTLFGLNAIRVVDDTTSIATQGQGGLLPQEGITGSADVSVKIGEEITVEGELAGSAFSRNLRSPEIDDAEIISKIITPRESTRLDYGARGTIDYNAKNWGGALLARYLGDGFVPLGYPYAQTDLIEFSVAPRARLLGNRLLLNGSLGYRVNNLQKTSLATSSQIIGTLNLTGRIGEQLTISGTYSNFGFESAFDQDTLKIKTITQNIGLAPSLTLRGETATQMVTLSFNLSDFTEENTLTTRQSVNDMLAFVGTWSVTMHSVPFSGSVTASYLQNNLSLGRLTVLSGSVGGAYRLFNGDVTPSLRFSWSQNGIAQAEPDQQFGLRFGLGWSILERLTLNLTGTITRHSYGDIRPGASYTEYVGRTGLSTRW